VKRRKAGANKSIYLYASEVAFVDANDIDLSSTVHDVLELMRRLDSGAEPDQLLEEFEKQQKREREIFMATLETYSVGRVVDQVHYMKRRRAITEIHRGLEAVMGPPPWSALGYRERIREYHKDTLKDVGISPEELEGYSRVRGFIEDDPTDTLEYLPRLPKKTQEKATPEKERKEAKEMLERQISNFVNRTPKSKLEELKEQLSDKEQIQSACEKAGVTFEDLWSEALDGGQGD
jgi:hypothetical protein